MKRHISAITAATVWWAQAAAAQNAAPPSAAPAAPSAQDAASAAPSATSDHSAELAKQVEAQRADIDDQDQRIQALEQALKALKPAPAKSGGAGPSQGSAVAPGAQLDHSSDPFPFKVSGYIQSQYEYHQDSEDQLLPGGAPLNQNRFLLRRVRVKLERGWQYGGALVELDANTVHGPAIGLQHAEVSLAYRNADHTPLVGVTMGLFDNPFGWELVESPRERPFMERSFGSREFFPAEPDLGVRVAGQVAWFRYSVAAVNGQPIGDRTGFVLQDPNNHKDIVGRVGVAVDVRPTVRVSGGVSVLNGMGFHAGSDATKGMIAWKDLNENGQVDPGETQGQPGKAAVPSQNFERWALGADLSFDIESAFGKSKLYAELSAGSNMDRNVFVADPTTASFDQREFGYYVGFIHEFKTGPIVGLRIDSYNPNSDFLNRQAGKLIPTTETVTTYCPLVGFQIPHRVRLLAQYDAIHDALAFDSAGVPTDKKNNIVTVRLQGEL